MAKGLPEYSDEDLLNMLNEFKKLSKEEQEKRRLGAGVDKIVYDVPDKDVVIKLPNLEREYNKNSLDSDYLYSKLMNKSIPVETPVLLKDPSGTDTLFQRKIRPIAEDAEISSGFYDSLYDRFPKDADARSAALKSERDRIKNLPDEKAVTDYFKSFDKAGLNDADLHRGNLGVDSKNITKAIDVAPFYYDRIDNAGRLNSGLSRVRDTFFDKMEKLTKPTIYRSFGPLAAKTALAAGGGLVSLASEAADSEETGDAPEQAALLREIDERKRRDANPELAPLYENIDNNSRVSPQDTLKINALKKLAGK